MVQIRPLAFFNHWQEPCKIYGASLLATDSRDYCCSNGLKRLKPLSPLLPIIQDLSYEQANRVFASNISRVLNNTVTFSALGVDGDVVPRRGQWFLAIEGRYYRRMFPTKQGGHPANTFVYGKDPSDKALIKWGFSNEFQAQFSAELEAVSPFFEGYRRLHEQFPN